MFIVTERRDASTQQCTIDSQGSGRSSDAQGPSEVRMFVLRSPASETAASDAGVLSAAAGAASTSAAVGTSPRQTPPVPMFAMREARVETHERVAGNSDSPAVMEDADEGEGQHRPQQQPRGSDRSRIAGACSGSPFRGGSSTQRRQLELRLRSPPRSAGRGRRGEQRGERDGGGCSGDGQMDGGCCRQHSASSPPRSSPPSSSSQSHAAAVASERQQRRHHQPADPEDANAAMVEVDTEEGGGATDDGLSTQASRAGGGRGPREEGHTWVEREARTPGVRLLEAKVGMVFEEDNGGIFDRRASARGGERVGCGLGKFWSAGLMRWEYRAAIG